VLVLLLILVVPGTPPGSPAVGAHRLPSRVRAAAGGAGTDLLVYALTNSEPAPTGPYAQPVYLDAQAFSPELNGNLSNLAFEYPNGTLITSWIESGANNSSTSTLVWLRLASIGAGATVYIDAVAYPRSSFLFSILGPTGEAPELSGGFSQAGFARWDDGARVFPFYANFSGTRLPSGWVASPGLSFQQSNGLHFLQEAGNDGGLNTTETFGPGSWFDVYGEVDGLNGVTFSGFVGAPNGGTCTNFGDCRVAIFEDSRSVPRSVGGQACVTGTCGTTPYFQQGLLQNATGSVDWENGSANFTRNYTTERSVTTGVPTSPMSLHVWTTANVGLTTTEDAYVSWVRERPALPGDRYPTVVELPTAPSGVAATVEGASSVYLAWTNPIGLELVNTSIELSRECSGSGIEISTGGPTQGWLLVGLTANTSYCARISAWSAGGESPFSSWASFTTGATTVALPSAPTAPGVTVEGTSSAYLKWVNPTGAPLLNSTIELSPGCSGSGSQISTGGATQGWLLLGLTPDASYCARVSAWNVAGEGPFSSWTQFTTSANAPAAGRPPAPTGLAATVLSNSTALLSWSNPGGGALVNDTIFLGSSCSALDQAVSTHGATEDWLASALVPGRTYCAQVTVWNTVGESNASDPATFTLPPIPLPPAPSAGPSSPSPGTTLAWLGVGVAVGAAIVGAVVWLRRRAPPHGP
jgi:hypothetical protein